MYPGFIWIVIVICQLSPIVSSVDRIGILEVQIYYQNMEGVVWDGQTCDPFVFDRLCDIFFEICLTEDGDPRPCNVFFLRTNPVRNAVRVNQSINIDYYTNKKLHLKIKAFDFDHLSAPDEMGEFLYSFFPNSLPPERRIKEVERKGAHATSMMTLLVSKTCAFNHFGDECLLCSVPEDRGYCDSHGSPSCYPGYSGSDCSLHDSCQNATCASFATCRRIGESFICLCDDTSGERCEDGYDPCKKHICEHGGTCVRTGEHMNFAKCVNCTSGWEGLHCERKLNACELETLKLGHPPCENGGHCIVNPTNNTISVCLCAPGWQGDRCDVSFSKASAVVIVISTCLLILIICCAIFIVYRCRLSVRSQLRGMELIQAKTETNGFSRTNDLYGITQNQIDNSYRAILKKNDALVKTIPQAIPADDDEYETMLDHEKKTYSTTAAPELVEEEDYELVRHEAVSVSNYGCGQIAYINSIKRPLPSKPSEGEGYEYL